ncbi:MAG TPA: DUF4142 domain-containing protein [Albitalea sp.]
MRTLAHAAAASLAAALAVSGCGRSGDSQPAAGTASPPAESQAAAGSASAPPPESRAASGPASAVSRSGTAAAPGEGGPTPRRLADDGPAWSVAAPAAEANPSATSGGAVASAVLPGPDAEFVARAAQHAAFEVEIAKLGVERAADPLVKAYAQMLADDHAAAHERLRQIAGSHSVPLPGAMPPDKRKEIEALAQLSGADFDTLFVKTVGIDDHRDDIAAFEQAAQNARNEQVRGFAQSTLPTLRKHLSTAEKLPGVKGKG